MKQKLLTLSFFCFFAVATFTAGAANHNVTFSVISADGSNAYTDIELYNEQNTTNEYLKSGRLYSLPDGEYSCKTLTSERFPYPEKRVHFTLTKDTVITISFQDYFKVNCNITGDIAKRLSQENPHLQISCRFSNKNIYERISCRADENGNFSGLLYLPAGDYTYQPDLSYTVGAKWQTKEGSFTLAKDKTLDIDFSSDIYRQVTFKLVDEKGNTVEKEGWLYLDDDVYGINITPDNKLASFSYYMADGEHEAYFDGGGCTLAPQVTEFTIDGTNQLVTLTYTESPVHTLHATLKVPQNATNRENGCSFILTFHNNGRIADETVFDIEESTTAELDITLSEGTYQYGLGMLTSDVAPAFLSGEITISGDGQKLDFDISDYPTMEANVVDENGKLLDCEYWSGLLNSEGKFTYWFSPYNYFVLPEGSYNLTMAPTNDSSYGIAKQTVTLTKGMEHQVVNVRLPKAADNDKFIIVAFVSCPFVGTVEATIDIEGFGTSKGAAIAFIPDVPAGTYNYTVTAPGFKTVHGTLDVNEDVMGYDGLDLSLERGIALEITMKRDKNGSSGVETVATDGIAVYPTIVTEEVHIAPKVDGKWSLRIISASGLTVYSSPRTITSETVIPMSSLPKGLYLIVMDSATERHIFKVIKK